MTSPSTFSLFRLRTIQNNYNVNTLCVNAHVRDRAPAKSDCAVSLLSTQIQTKFSVRMSSCFCNCCPQICVICPAQSHMHQILFLFLATHGSLSVPTVSPIILTTASNIQSSLTMLIPGTEGKNKHTKANQMLATWGSNFIHLA